MARFDTQSIHSLTAQQHLEQFCDDNELDVANFVAMEYPYNKKFQIVLGNHMFNETTQQIEADPNYIPPTN